jgi:hypothetical protein
VSQILLRKADSSLHQNESFKIFAPRKNSRISSADLVELAPMESGRLRLDSNKEETLFRSPAPSLNLYVVRFC